MIIPQDYIERTYAGVLGKIIGVYLGRPFEGWSYERIMTELGEITGYVHEKLNMPLIVTDDDISGTFTFLRALPDYGNTPDLTPQQIGQSWLNYIVEKKTILWWGGLGNSTEHTAYLRLKQGIPAPKSGSIELNSKVVAEQIGSQIFIDGWGMVNPGDPERAADFARRASSVSHDGEAIYGAQVMAAMEAQAYVEKDINVLLNMAVKLISDNSVIYRMINDIREWHAEFHDWHNTREQIEQNYGYDKFGGNCHMVPNHGLIIMSLLHGEDDFSKSLMMVNTAGWDTDCNSGNVGCLLGIKNGLATLEGSTNWRGPVADRLYLPTAEGGSSISDAVIESYKVVNIGRALAALEPVEPKNGSRFHFEVPGSMQGFQSRAGDKLRLENVLGHSSSGTRSLALNYHNLAAGEAVQATTPTFVPPEAINMQGYGLLACPTLYPGQVVKTNLVLEGENKADLKARIVIGYYADADVIKQVSGDLASLHNGENTLEWRMPDLKGAPIAEMGIELVAGEAGNGCVYLDYLTWEGEPDVMLTDPGDGSRMWKRAWVDSTDSPDWRYPETYRLIQNEGTGLLIQGTRQWRNYRVSADVTPHMVDAAGVAVRVQGLRRYYGMLLRRDNTAQLIKVLDGETVLASAPFKWMLGETYEMTLQAHGKRLQGWINGEAVFDVEDTHTPLMDGAIALVCREGRSGTQSVSVTPVR